MSVKLTPLINKELSYTPYNVNWIPHSSRLCVVGATNQGTGIIAVYGLSGKHLELKTETETNSAVRCGTITGQSRNFATGDFEGQLQIWDTQRFDIPLTSTKAHDSIINSIDSFNQPNEPQELVTGSRDGSVKIWDMRQTERAVITIKLKTTTKDIWAVAYGQYKGCRVVAVGYDDGELKLFDVVGSKYLWATKIKDGICSIEFSQEKLLVSTTTGAYSVDIDSGKTLEIQSKAETTLWSIRQVDSTLFAVAGGDGQLSIYKDLKPIDTLNLSKHPIISTSWHRDKKGLFACSSFDQSIKIGIAQNL